MINERIARFDPKERQMDKPLMKRRLIEIAVAMVMTAVIAIIKPTWGNLLWPVFCILGFFGLIIFLVMNKKEDPYFKEHFIELYTDKIVCQQRPIGMSAVKMEMCEIYYEEIQWSYLDSGYGIRIHLKDTQLSTFITAKYNVASFIVLLDRYDPSVEKTIVDSCGQILKLKPVK